MRTSIGFLQNWYISLSCKHKSPFKGGFMLKRMAISECKHTHHFKAATHS